MNKPMKQPLTPFSFKKNEGVHALPETASASVRSSTSRGKPGRPRDDEGGIRERQVSAYLTAEESEKLNAKLDGRPASTVVRRLILDYINHG